MLENRNALCSASEAKKQNLPDRTLDLPVFFRYKHITSLKCHLSLAQARASPTGFGATFSAVFVLNYLVERISFFCNR